MKEQGHYVNLQGEFELTLGRSSNTDIPVFIHKDRGPREDPDTRTSGEILRSYHSGYAGALGKVTMTVSKVHASLIGKLDGVYIRDNQSLNGTKIKGNRRKILLSPDEEVKLEDGDTIQLGSYKLSFGKDPDPGWLESIAAGEFKLRQSSLA